MKRLSNLLVFQSTGRTDCKRHGKDNKIHVCTKNILTNSFHKNEEESFLFREIGTVPQMMTFINLLCLKHKSLHHFLLHKLYWELHILLYSRDWGYSTVEESHHLTKKADAYLER